MNPEDVIIILVLIFGLVVYMLTIPTAMDFIVPALVPESAEYQNVADMAHKTANLYIPMAAGIGILVWGYAAATREEGYGGLR